MKAEAVSALRSKRGLRRASDAEPQVVGLTPQTVRVLIPLAAQGAQLALREFFARVLEGAIAARAQERRDCGTRQDKTLAMPQPARLPQIGQGAETIEQPFQARRAERTRPGRFSLVDRQRLGPSRLPQQPAGAGAQFAQIQLFGLAVFEITIAARAGKTLGETH